MFSKRTSLLALALAAGTLAIVNARPASQEYPQPGPQHDMLLEGVGTWEGQLTAYMPGVPAEPTAAVETVEGIGPFWTQSRFECQFMGMPYTGTGCVGYDTKKEKFVGTWIDSMSTYMALMEGEYDEASKTLTMNWEAPGMTGEMEEHRSETVYGGDSYVSTFYMGSGDQAMKSMVVEMKRKTAVPVEAGAGR